MRRDTGYQPGRMGRHGGGWSDGGGGGGKAQEKVGSKKKLKVIKESRS